MNQPMTQVVQRGFALKGQQIFIENTVQNQRGVLGFLRPMCDDQLGLLETWKMLTVLSPCMSGERLWRLESIRRLRSWSEECLSWMFWTCWWWSAGLPSYFSSMTLLNSPGIRTAVWPSAKRHSGPKEWLKLNHMLWQSASAMGIHIFSVSSNENNPAGLWL